jgi:single-strand DNA-binding protein
MNKSILMGRLTKDVELSYIGAENTAKASFTIAINRRFAKNNEVDFIPCTAWGKNAENIQKFFSKGNMINVVGAIRVDSWENDEGKRVYKTYVNVEEWNFCGEKKNDNAGEQDNPFVEDEENSDKLPF